MNIQMQFDAGALAMIAPLLVIGGLAFVVLLWDVIFKPANKSVLLWISLAGIGVAAALTLFQWNGDGIARELFGGQLRVDRFSLYFNLLFFAVMGLVFLISRDYLEREEIDVGEYYCLGLFALFGMMLLAMADDLIIIFIGIEVMSIAVYILAAFNRSNYRCIEGALKYFILGSFATGFLLYGIALLYGQTGTTTLAGIERYLSQNGNATTLVPLGIGLLLVGFAFKVAAVPFHMWAPDVYEGAATPVTAAMATGVKAAAFAALIRTFAALSAGPETGRTIIWVIAAATIVVGNITAIRQTNIKRMLAYSGVGHSGYLLAGLLIMEPGRSGVESGVGSLLFYLAAYVFMNIGAFAILIMIGRKEDEPVNIEDWAGLGFRHPWLGVAMTVFMLSLGGLPPTAGFFGKFYLFSAILEAGYTNLVILAVLTSVASFYFYLRIVVYMYMFPGTEKWIPRYSILSTAVVSVAVAVTLVMGLLPSGPLPFLEWAQASVKALS